MPADFNDQRWGGYVPWFLRQADFAARGDSPTFFSHLSQRLKRLFKFNECGVNFPHFGSCLETESLQRFKYDEGEALETTIHRYFSPGTLDYEVRTGIQNDEKQLGQMEEAIAILDLALNPPPITLGFGGGSGIQAIPEKDRAATEKQYANMKSRAETLRSNAKQKRYASLVTERIGVLKSCCVSCLSKRLGTQPLFKIFYDTFAASQVMLTIQTDDGFPRIVPLDEPL